MDHHELLTVTRRLALACHTVKTRRMTISPEWEFTITPVLFPESKCPYCFSVIRSSGIWFLADDRLYRLLGALFPTQGGPIKLVQPSHPHDTGGGYLCLGYNMDGIALLSSPPNLNDVPMGRAAVPRWLKRYWNHDCQEMRQALRELGYLDRIAELNVIGVNFTTTGAST